uniref:Beta-defensin-like domain-containing protein n=1 Tax=Meleagris gallopavo TaxID=9103 RepID=G1NN30_MELGA
MKILYLFLAVLLIVLQSSVGFMRVPNNEAQCEQAGGICSKDHCFHLHTRAFGRCQQAVPCCRTVDFYNFGASVILSCSTTNVCQDLRPAKQLFW